MCARLIFQTSTKNSAKSNILKQRALVFWSLEVCISSSWVWESRGGSKVEVRSESIE